MKDIKYELQNIIFGDEQIGATSQLKKAQSFIRRYAETGINAKEQQQFQSKEEAVISTFPDRSFFY